MPPTKVARGAQGQASPLADLLQQLPPDVVDSALWQHLTPGGRRALLQVDSHVRKFAKEQLITRLKLQLLPRLLESTSQAQHLQGFSQLRTLDIALQDTHFKQMNEEPERLAAALACITASNDLRAMSVRVHNGVYDAYDWQQPRPVLTRQLLDSALEHCASLKKLQLIGFKATEGSSLIALTSCTQLTALVIVFADANCSDSLEKSVLASMPLLPSLQSLKLNCLSHEAQSVSLAMRAPSLTALDLSSWEFQEMHSMLAGLTSLQVLALHSRLSEFAGFLAPYAPAIAGLTSLRKLIAPMADLSVQSVSSLRCLQILSISHLIEDPAGGGAAQQCLPSLTSLTLHGDMNEMEQVVRAFPNLQQLRSCPQHEQTDLSEFKETTAAVPRIFLMLGPTWMSPKLLGRLRGWTNLQGVRLHSLGSTPASEVADCHAAIPECLPHVRDLQLVGSMCDRTPEQLLQLCDSLPMLDNLTLDMPEGFLPTEASLLIRLWSAAGRARGQRTLTISLPEDWEEDELKALDEQLQETGCTDLKFI